MTFVRARVFPVFLAIVLTLAFAVNTVTAYGAQTAPLSFSINAKSALLMEPTTGKVLYEQNPHEKLPLASVTKIMTILLIYEAIDFGKIKWDDIVTVSPHAASMGGSQIFLEPTEQQTVRDLTKSVVVASANDAAVAMAEFIAGGEEAFVAMANAKAKELGMNNSNFVNACGLDAENHYSSAYDIALMSRELINKYPQVFEFSTIWMDKIFHKTAKGVTEFGLSNTNKLLKSYSGATGLKTGSTSNALFCISATAKRDNMQLISVIMAAPDPAIRFTEAGKLLDYGFTNFTVVEGDKPSTVKGSVKIYKGEHEQIDVAVKNQVNIVIPRKKTSTLESKVEVVEALKAPINMGTKAGEVVYFFEGAEVGRSDLITLSHEKKASLFDIMGRLLNRWVG